VSILKRVGQLLATLAVLSVLLFRVLTAMPGNPVELLITSNPGVRPEDVARLKRLRGLDQPWYVQYVRWVWGHHEARQPPIYRGVRLGVATIHEPWSADVTTHLQDPDASAPPTLTVVSDGVRLEGGSVHATFGSVGINPVLLIATDADGLQTAIRIDVEVRTADRQPVKNNFRLNDPGTKSVDENQAITADLKPALQFAPEGTTLRLVRGEGLLTDGVYTHHFAQPGQSVAVVEASAPDGQRTLALLTLDHGPVPDPSRFHRGFLFGNLGFSNTYKRPVADILFGRVANTLRLMVPAFLLALLLAVPLGVFTARRQYTRWDYFFSSLAFAGISVPVFWLGIMLIILFSVVLRVLPPGGMATPGVDDVVDKVEHAILPVLVLGLAYAGRWLRYVRTAMLEVLGQDYIRTARAKGLSETVVIWKHAFRNALIPIVTVLALSIPSLFSGAVLTETVFSWPGVGRLIFESVMNSDSYVAMVAFLISAALVMLSNILADVLYVLVDPRMRKRA